MTQQERQIFRQKSLDKLSSPDQLDQLLRIVKPQSWVLLAAIGSGIALLVVWGVLGRVPATARGAAILVHPKQVVGFQSPASGQVAEILVEVGQLVTKDQQLATLNLPALVKEIDQEKAKLELVQGLTSEMTELERKLAHQEREYIARREDAINKRKAAIEKAAENYRTRSHAYLAEQRNNLALAERLSTELGEALKDRLQGLTKLHEADTESKFALIEPRAALIDNQLRCAEIGVKSAELSLRLSQVDEYYDTRMDVVRDLEIELDNLQVRRMVVERRLMEDQNKGKREIKAIRARIEQLENHLEIEGQLRSQYSGRILEITTALGQQVVIGQSLGKMEIEDTSAELKAIAYFEIKSGKKIEPGNPIRISPTTVERERFGGIVGTVESVSDYPVTIAAASHQIGDEEVARNLLGGEARIEVVAVLKKNDTTPTPYEWTGSGPEDVSITPGTTADVRVTIEERAPITLVLPFLKSLMGGG